MRQAEDGHDDAGHVVGAFFTGEVRSVGLGGADAGGKGEGLADGKMGEVLVDFLVVAELALEVLGHEVLRDAIVVDH